MTRQSLLLLCALQLCTVPCMAGQPQIASRAATSFAIDTNGRLLGWGDDSAGQLAQGRLLQSAAALHVGSGFAAVATAPGVPSLAAGFGHAVALKTDGSLWAWGHNDQGQLGDGTTTDRSGPMQIGTGYSSVAAGYDYTIAVKADGTLWA